MWTRDQKIAFFSAFVAVIGIAMSFMAAIYTKEIRIALGADPKAIPTSSPEFPRSIQPNPNPDNSNQFTKPTPIVTPTLLVTLPISKPSPSQFSEVESVKPYISRENENCWKVKIPRTNQWVDTGIPVNYWNNVNVRPEIDDTAGSILARLGDHEFHSNFGLSANIYLGRKESMTRLSYFLAVPPDFQDTLKLKVQDSTYDFTGLVVKVYICMHHPNNCNHKE